MHFVLFRTTQLSELETRPPGVQQHLHPHHDSCALMSLTHCLLRSHTHTHVCICSNMHSRRDKYSAADYLCHTTCTRSYRKLRRMQMHTYGHVHINGHTHTNLTLDIIFTFACAVCTEIMHRDSFTKWTHSWLQTVTAHTHTHSYSNHSYTHCLSIRVRLYILTHHIFQTLIFEPIQTQRVHTVFFFI